MSDYGKRGGTSASAGRKASVYEAVSPVGEKVKFRSFQVHTDDAMASFYFHKDCGNGHAEGWYKGGVDPVDSPPSWMVEKYGRLGALRDPENYQLVRATRITQGH